MIKLYRPAGYGDNLIRSKCCHSMEQAQLYLDANLGWQLRPDWETNETTDCIYEATAQGLRLHKEIAVFPC